MNTNYLHLTKKSSADKFRQYSLLQKLHLDGFLLTCILILFSLGLIILYSAGGQNIAIINSQIAHIGLALVVMFIFAQIPPDRYRLWTPWVFGFGIILLLAVLITGHIGKGAQRWLTLGILRFQPSEIMKLALPMMLAWYFHNKDLPPTYKQLLVATFIILIPVILTAKQPDLGTAILIGAAGFCVLLLAGTNWRLILSLGSLALAALPILWHFMHDYQRQRVLTFFNPERDPLGKGYHIIQSKIAVGSGGIFGKGWLNGSQSHLQFLPEHSTDFIFAVCGEEFGLVGCLILIGIYLLLISRCLYIATEAQDTFTRLLSGSLTLAFFFSMFINIGMVTGILPVVGIPLPLISYGGTTIVTVLASMGILMSIHTHRKLLGK